MYVCERDIQENFGEGRREGQRKEATKRVVMVVFICECR